MSTTLQPLSTAEDKAFKREAMRTPNTSRSKELSRWLNGYVPPETKAEPPKQRFYDRKRAELVEKARVTALLEHRARAIKATAHHWPRYREMAIRDHNARISKEAQRRERIRLAAEAEELVDDVWLTTTPRQSPLLSCKMPSSLSMRSSPSNIAALSLVSMSCSAILRPLLYREVTVSDRANELVRTLAKVRGVASLVKSLTFEGSLCAYIPDAEWAEAVLLLHNLRHLTISHHVPLEWSSLPFIRFKLLSFTLHGLVIGTWAGLLHLQPELEELCLHSDFLAQPPGRDALPVLRCLTAPTADLSKFAALHPLEGMVFAVGSPWASTLKTGDMQRFATSNTQLVMLRIGSSQLLRLFRDVPDMVARLRHLALDEDKSWSRNSVGAQRSLMRVAQKLEERTPRLERFRLVCSIFRGAGASRSMRSDRADGFAIALRESPLIHNHHIPISNSNFQSHEPSRTCKPRACADREDVILAELARLGEGGPTKSVCAQCGSGISRHRCLDCFWAECLCATCLVKQHAEHPLHRIETWIGGRWVRQALKSLGLRLQLGHGAGGQCLFPVPKVPFFIVGRHGIQEVTLDFCGCDSARTRTEQLRQARLLATAQIDPGSAVAFNLMDAAQKKTRALSSHHTWPPDSPPPPSRPNLWPTPFVPAVEQSWRLRRPRSQPIGAESADRVRAALEGGAAAAEELWTSAMRELEDWAYREPKPESVYTAVDQIERAWAMGDLNLLAARLHEMGPGVRQDIVEGRSDGERPETGWEAEESRWGSDQWINVLNMTTAAMREPERRRMLDEEYRRERWEMHRQWGSRRAFSHVAGARALGHARDVQRQGDEAERTRCQEWDAEFADFMVYEYID
ncbi:hypothetical protein DFH09DRAFT_1098572 [Mycena vulgaris]|nr:hypothetical protein DFH09DRAFT_1098572 [Mycena vulgaris]